MKSASKVRDDISWRRGQSLTAYSPPPVEMMLVDAAAVKTERKIENLVDFVKSGES